MRTFEVRYQSETKHGYTLVHCENQCEALMEVMRFLSEDGIHAPQCKIHVRPL